MISFKRVILFALIPIAVILGIAFFGFVGGGASTQLPAAATQPPSQAVDQVMFDSADLERAAQKAEEASKKVYEGMGKIEEVHSDAEGRTQHLDDARNTASGKLESLADKIRSTEKSGEPLTPVERVNVDRLLDSKQ